MAEIDTLLAHLSPSFTSQTENIAVEALGYVLNKYAGSRKDWMTWFGPVSGT